MARFIAESTYRATNKLLYLFLGWSAIIVLGIDAWYLSNWKETPKYPSARLVYTIVIASLAIISSHTLMFVWLKTPKWLLIINNLCFGLAFFAAYGALENFACKDDFAGWGDIFGKHYLTRWSVTEAFCFISGFLWLGAALFSHPIFERRFISEKSREKRPSGVSSESGDMPSV